jgi:uncharacterized membrane protein YkvA (DUF1232 family)
VSHARRRAQEARRDVMVLYLACRDPRVPWYAKTLAAALVAYALSPVDLIPDFIPVLATSMSSSYCRSACSWW